MAPAEACEAFIRRILPATPDSVVERFADALLRSAAELIPTAKRVLEKPYGKNYLLEDHGEYGLSLAVLLPGRSTSLHYHTIRREIFCVRTGVLTLRTEESSTRLGRAECACSTPGVPHSLANDAADVLEVLEIFSPALLDDKVRVSDRYARRLGQVAHNE